MLHVCDNLIWLTCDPPPYTTACLAMQSLTLLNTACHHLPAHLSHDSIHYALRERLTYFCSRAL